MFTLTHQAKQKRFSTEISKPKKLEKSRVKSGNVQRFLAQKEAEERKKHAEEKKKKEVRAVLVCVLYFASRFQGRTQGGPPLETYPALDFQEDPLKI